MAPTTSPKKKHERESVDTTIVPLCYAPPNAGRRIGVSTRKIYELIAAGELRSYKLGKGRRITDAELQRYVEHKEAQASAAAAPRSSSGKRRGSKAESAADAALA